MRILIVIGNASIGGAQRVALNLCEWLNTQPDMKADIVSLSRVSGKVYNIPGLIQLEKKSATRELRSLIHEKKADVIVSMGVPMALHTVPACWGTKTKHIISERNDPRHFAGKGYVRILSRMLMRTADGFVFQTEDARKFYHMEENTKATVIHNPLMNIDNIPTASEKPEKVIVTAGRLVPQKNHKLLIEAFAEISSSYPEYKLIIYGEGPERNNLEVLIAELGLSDRVSLPGTTPEVLVKYASSSIFVLSSDFEGMPNALMEAMAVGLPCISTDCPCGGPGELIENGKNGLLIPVGDKNVMKEALRLLIDDRNKARNIGLSAKEIRVTHSMAKIGEQWLKLLSRK